MINYEWTDSSEILLSVDEPTQVADQTRQILDHYNNQNMADNYLSQPSSFSFQQQQHQPQVHSMYDSGAFSLSYSNPMSPEIVTGATNGCMVIPKSENGGSGSMTTLDYQARIGLNLGGRTYFSSSDDDIVNRLYRRSRLIESGPSNSPRCQAEGCNVDLTHAKHYHRRHKVCEFHSKASTVIAGGMTQRFCQQCSRFHLIREFDQGKRSCRKRLADHNRRRRKSQPIQPQPQQQSHQESTQSSPSETRTRSSPESSVVHSTAVTVAASPAPMFSHVGSFRSFERSQSMSWNEEEEVCGQTRGLEFKN